ncbi:MULTISPECIES: serine hydrolase [Brevibacillus]|uniref:serine hydrolase n=1 Tax=Brevibacillus TaxID=55080 RepID=UPI0015624655|nr:serine hydrolase [Brevibacillus borstelensis]MBE5395441.1 serine hydrolase [Brevibacillus borstelensis]WNF06946.1 serine hydrolase [Brevibacillus borstelensis]
MKSLQEKLETIIAAAGGQWGVVVEEINGSFYWEHNTTQTFAAESIIKVPVMAAVFDAASKGNVRFDQAVRMKQTDQVAGSGVMQHLTPDTHYPVYDLITLMIIQSDNTATNMLIDLIGEDQVRLTMAELGMHDSCYSRKLMLYPADSPPNNMITAGDIARMLKRLATGTFLGEHACRQMIGIMKKQQVRNALPARLPRIEEGVSDAAAVWEMANKTGWDTGRQHDVGILFAGGKAYSLTALSENAPPDASLQAMAAIGYEVYRCAVS